MVLGWVAAADIPPRAERSGRRWAALAHRLLAARQAQAGSARVSKAPAEPARRPVVAFRMAAQVAQEGTRVWVEMLRVGPELAVRRPAVVLSGEGEAAATAAARFRAAQEAADQPALAASRPAARRAQAVQLVPAGYLPRAAQPAARRAPAVRRAPAGLPRVVQERSRNFQFRLRMAIPLASLPDRMATFGLRRRGATRSVASPPQGRSPSSQSRQ